MIRTSLTFALFAAVLTLTHAEKSQADLMINLDFTNFNTNAPADGSSILGGASRVDAQNVIQAAANYWTNAFANSNSSRSWAVAGRLTQNISVGWQSHGGATLATGGTGWFVASGQFSGGLLNFDNDGSSLFYVDSTPSSNSEWLQSSQRTIAFNGVNMNAERVQFDATGLARSNNDLLSTSIHEIGHALGFLSSYPGFVDADIGSDGDIDITSGAFNGAQIPVSGGHTSFQLLTPSGQFPYNPGGGSFAIQPYHPNVMGPFSFTGTRSLLTEADIAIMAQTLGFDMNTVNFNPSITAVPEPSSIALFSIAIGMVWVAKRRRYKQFFSK
jgi:PEP-CTERM motif